MPGTRGRRNKRERGRGRRRMREAAEAPAGGDEAVGTAARPVRPRREQPATPSSRGGGAMALPSVRVRITGAMVGIITILGAAYMVIAGSLNGSSADSIVSVGAGVIMLGIGTFVVALVLFPGQIRDFLHRGR